jgi:xanthine dehydrogenase YagR molybdenum-binding subunit
MPEIEILWTIGITGTGAAVANAIYNTCGKRICELPITLDELFM